MFPYGVDPPARPPLGWPIRREDWYYISDTFVTATITVYPGELVGCSEKNYNQLAGLEPPQDTEEDLTEVVVLKYPQMVVLLEKNGFIKL